MTDSVGARIAQLRRQRRLSQRELASELGRSESWMSQVERGIQPVERLSILQSVADTLGVTVQELRPEVIPEPEPTDKEPVVNDLDAVRLCLSGHPALELLFTAGTDDAEPTDLESLQQSVARAWDLTHESQFAEFSAALVDLLPRLERAAREPAPSTQQELHALRAGIYQAVAAVFARQGEADAAWVAADRAISAAEQAGDPLEVAAGHFRLAHAFMRLRRNDQAERVVTGALTALQTQVTNDPSAELLSLYGAMHLVAAVISAREDNRSAAHEHLRVAEEIGVRLGEDRNDFGTEFGPTNVQLHRVSVAVDLADAGQALEIAEHVDPSALSPERQTRFYIDLARAHSLRRHVGEAVAALLAAEQTAPEQMRSNPQVRATVQDLLAVAAHRASEELRSLAQRLIDP